jgi:class 3 adenylate cyclase
MVRAGGSRVATVVMLDIVRSTRVAAEIGDEQWRTVLRRFRSTVRRGLRRFAGHEEDTAGDGFFTTFERPVDALAFAVDVARDVQALGLDVRGAIHTADVGATEDGRPGGLGVHVAARLLSLAPPAEVFCTSTVRDLVLGSGYAFEDAGTHRLRDVPGEWPVVRLAGTPAPLESEVALARLVAVRPESSPGVRRSVMAVAIAAGLVVLAVVAAVGLSGSPTPAAARPALLRIDPSSDHITRTVGIERHDENVVVGAADGVLWQRAGDTLVARRASDGGDAFAIPVDGEQLLRLPAFGFGAAWTIEERSAFTSHPELVVTRYDERSGDSNDVVIEAPSLPYHPFAQSGNQTQYGMAFGAFVAGPTGLWFLSGGNTRLYHIDPTTLRVRSWETGAWSNGDVGPTQILAAGRVVWICAPWENQIRAFDVSQGRILGIPRAAPNGACPIAASTDGHHVWLLDRSHAVVTAVDGDTGSVVGSWGIGPSAGSGNGFDLPAYGFDALWLPAGRSVYRFDLQTGRTSTIAMPAGVNASSVAIDDVAKSVWVGNCDPSSCTWMPRR